ncbi:MAG: putative metal-binding protein [Amaricoccus sp.]
MLEALSRAAFSRDVGRIHARSARLYGWTILESGYPLLDVLFDHATAVPVRLRLTCTDWDELPPAIELLDAGGRPVVEVPPNAGGVFNSGPHPITGRPFVCMRGAREYHAHESHTTDSWDNYRGISGMDLGGIVLQLWRAWKRSVG